MKTLFLIPILFLSLNVFAETCKCNLVSGKTALSGKYFPDRGETFHTVPQGSELWVTMSPAASWNRGENGGCRLQPGEQYIADANGIPVRAVKCGNAILQYRWYTHQGATTVSTYNSGNNEVNSSLKRIENNQTIINDNITATYQQGAIINQKTDYIIAQNDEILGQVKKARTEAWIQTGIGVTATIVDGLITRKAVKNNRSIVNTTTITNNYTSGGTRPVNNGGVWGGNTNH